jgi:hypothetical protein
MADSQESNATARTTSGPGTGLDDTLKLLADSRRRAILKRLLAEEHLDEAVAVTDGGEDDSAEAACELAVLRHVHLPKLAAANVIQWDRESGVLARGRNFDRVRPLVESLSAAEQVHIGDA